MISKSLKLKKHEGAFTGHLVIPFKDYFVIAIAIKYNYPLRIAVMRLPYQVSFPIRQNTVNEQ